MADERIPRALAQVVGDVLGNHYYSHNRINSLLFESGVPGDPQESTCVEKVIQGLLRASQDPNTDAYAVLGQVLQHYMDVVGEVTWPEPAKEIVQGKARIERVLARFGLTYIEGGRILGGAASVPTRSLEALLREGDLRSVDVEFTRAIETVEKDPPAAVTAACAIVEALCKVYIEDEGLTSPTEKTVKPLWRVVQSHIGFDPSSLEDDDLKRILSGLSSIVDGIGALRTHIGSAHGRGRRPYRVEPRHARLAVHSAHSLVAFVLETWSHRRAANRISQ